jgi:putative membrane protein
MLAAGFGKGAGMTVLANGLVALTALLHVGFLVLEMFLWSGPTGRKVFRMSAGQAEATRVLAANQGLYNGFLAAGLFWSLAHGDAAFALQLKLFFLVCVIIAAIYGAWSVKPRILLVQGGPAIIALVLTLLAS